MVALHDCPPVDCDTPLDLCVDLLCSVLSCCIMSVNRSIATHCQIFKVVLFHFVDSVVSCCVLFCSVHLCFSCSCKGFKRSSQCICWQTRTSTPSVGKQTPLSPLRNTPPSHTHPYQDKSSSINTTTATAWLFSSRIPSYRGRNRSKKLDLSPSWLVFAFFPHFRRVCFFLRILRRTLHILRHSLLA